MHGRLLKLCIGAAVGAILAGALMAGIGAAHTRSGRCSFLPPAGPAHNGWRPAERALAPAGPSEIRLCRYESRNNPPGTDGDQLVGHGLVRGAAAARLARMFDALRTAKPGDRFRSCLFDDAPLVAYAEYPDGRSVTLFSVTSNCWSVTNGDVTRSAGASAWIRLRGRLLRLTRA